MNNAQCLRVLKNIELDARTIIDRNDNAKSLKKEFKLALKVIGADTSAPYDSVRDNLTPVEQEALLSLQRANTSMIELGYNYEHRKTELERLYQRLWFEKLKEEHIILEA